MLLRHAPAQAWDPQHEGNHNLFGICSYYKYAQNYLYREDRYIYIGHPQNSWRRRTASPAAAPRAPGRTGWAWRRDEGGRPTGSPSRPGPAVATAGAPETSSRPGSGSGSSARTSVWALASRAAPGQLQKALAPETVPGAEAGRLRRALEA